MVVTFKASIEEVGAKFLTEKRLAQLPPPGKSDPFAVFTLNGQKVFKSQTKKKTVSPDWNENFVVSVVRF